jgi:hypothetical protein
MNIIKSIFFISFLAVTSASFGEHRGLEGTNYIPSDHDHIDGGCTLGSLGPAYTHQLCNADGTYNPDAPSSHIWNALQWQMHNKHPHTHPQIIPSNNTIGHVHAMGNILNAFNSGHIHGSDHIHAMNTSTAVDHNHVYTTN